MYDRELERLLGVDALVRGPRRLDYLHDSTQMQGLRGEADAVVSPTSVEQVSALVGWCYQCGVAIIPRGGGSGLAGGAVPVSGGIVCSLERLDRIRQFSPELWRLEVEAGVTTGRIHQTARSHGLYYPPDPGASEQSQIGGNIACNAGGAHSFKYGVTGAWVTGIEAVVAEGRVVRFGGPMRKDVAGYDVGHLFVGAEGTLGIVTAAWLRLIPAPEVEIPLVAVYGGLEPGCAAVKRVYESGLLPATLDYADRAALDAARGSFPDGLPDNAGFLLIAEADGSTSGVTELLRDLEDILSEDALAVRTYPERDSMERLWRWRDGMSFAVSARRGGKMSEDVAVPVELLFDAVRALQRVGEAFDLETCSWGHAGDGNLHATFLVDASDVTEIARAERAAAAFFAEVIALGGTVSGEHGLGWVKRDQFDLQFSPEEANLQRTIKQLFDPKNLFNPGKKVSTVPCP